MPLPLFGLAVGATLSTIIVPLVIKVLVALGIGVVAYAGINELITNIQDFVVNSLSGIPGTIIAIAGLCQIDTVITMILSAVSIRVSLAITNGALKRWRLM